MPLDIAQVRRQEAFLCEHPLLFRLKVVLHLLLGLLIFGSVVLGSLTVIMLVVALLFTGKAWLLLAKLSKLVLVLLLPLWGMLRISARALCSRTPKPSGRWLKAEEAPTLFAALERMRKTMNGPRISGVVLFDEMNAFALSRPLGGFWFLLFRQHFIGLGVPLIQTLSEEEALAVVAHEYGHIAGRPSRFDAFVYRLRWRLVELLQHISQWNDWPSRWLARLLSWYIPRFDRLAFALCRAAEYAADDAGRTLIGSQPAAQALMRMRVAANYMNRDFWPRIHRRVEEESDPSSIRPWSHLPHLVRENHDDDLAADLLRDALHEETDVYDTHPALRDRLAAMHFDIADYQGAGCGLAPVAERTAAESWFGEGLADVLDSFDREWADGIREGWQARHNEWVREQQQRRELEARDEANLSDDEAWTLLVARINHREVADPDGEIWQFIQAHPRHAASRLVWGWNNLQADEKRAVQALFDAMRLDHQLIGKAAAALASHYGEDNPFHQRLCELLVQRHAKETLQ